MAKIGDTIPVSVQLFDNDTTKFVNVLVRDATGAHLTGSPKTIAHIGGGLYEDTTFLMPNTSHVSVVYKIYDDVGLTTPSAIHGSSNDIIPLTIDNDVLLAIQNLLAKLITAETVNVVPEEVVSVTVEAQDEVAVDVTPQETVTVDKTADATQSVGVTDESTVTVKEEC